MNTDTPPRTPRRAQAEATRALLLQTAERLYAERGLAQVSNRQIVEAAGQANNSALTYHVGTRTDLIHAIARSHGGDIADRTQVMVERAHGVADPRVHVASLVLPYIDHLASLGNPSWFARFTAQVCTDPAFAAGLSGERLLGDRKEALDVLWSCMPDLPIEQAALREQAVRMAIIHTCAERERVAAETGEAADWGLIGHALTDAATGLLLAPRHPRG
ncbi:TetR family transcriptional regulator [Actinokineospora enzanensis]|uniref:TetR family transcriptional regulator n=1 Tax=Actinokineospora enzanensis TaxID=155975 RepID=UPI00036CAB74|nr:TetR family transcriptional regulator [Actinokineospora enzanensis]